MRICEWLCAFALLVFALLTPLASAVDGLVINEFLAKGSSGDDWLEIYNGSASTADLTDLYLTDSDTDLTQWRFPSISLGAGEYMVVFASGKDRRDAGQPLHTNFKLSTDGEYLALLDGDGFTVIHAYAPSFPEQLTDVSYGISTNADQERRYFSIPTPGQQNHGDYLGIVEDTKFSIDRGFYSEPFELVITSATEEASIRYTIDCSAPTEVYGTEYTGPILIDKTTVVRALAYKTGYRSTDVDTQSYLFPSDVVTQPNYPPGFPATWQGGPSYYAMDPNVVNNPLYNPLTNALMALPTVSLVTAKPNLFDNSYGIYVNGGAQGVAWERPASAEWFGTNGTALFQIDCGVRIQGGAGRGYKKHSFRLLFKNMYGPSKLDADIFPGPRVTTSFDTFILRAGWNDAYSGGTHQYFLDECARRSQLAMGVPASHGTFVHLYVDGLYWGLYNAAEKPDQAFGEAYVGGSKDSYDVMAIGEAIEGTATPWNQLISLCQSGPMTDELYERIQGNNPDGTPNPANPDYLDVDNYIDYLMARQWMGDWDWPWNNWHALRNRDAATDGGFKFAAWDAEGWNMGGNKVDPGGMNSGAGVPYVNLFPNPEFKLRYADHIYRHYFNGGALTTNQTLPRFSGLAAIVEPVIMAENARWGGSGWTLDQWRGERNSFLNQIPQRLVTVLQQYRDFGLYPAIDPPTFSQRGGIITNGFSLTMASPESVYYTLDNTDPRERGTGNVRGSPYTAPLTLTYSVVVKARARTADGVWSALNEALFVVPAVEPLHVSELMYNPRDPEGVETNGAYSDDDFEFIELHNGTGSRVGLAGMEFTDGITFDFLDGSVLALDPGEYVLVVKNKEAFTNRCPLVAGLHIAGEYKGSLDNGGEEVTLKDGLGEVMFSFTYNDSRGWPPAADGGGHSLVPLRFEGQNDGALDYGGNWRPSAYRDGSPGVADPVLPLSVRINEVVAHTDYSNPSRPEYDSNDAIELFNAGASAITLAQWYLSDSIDDLKKWPIPGTDVITGGSRITYDEVSGFHNPITSGFGLNKAGEEVFLSYLPGTAEDRIVDCVRFKGQENGRSLGRYADGESRWYTLAPSMNAPNPAPVFEVVISEVMYHPRPTADSPEDNTDDEYIEIRNVRGGAAPLWTVAGAWRVDGDVKYDFPDNFTLAAGGVALLVPFSPTNTVARTLFLNAYGLTNNEVQLLGPYSGKLSNRGNRVALERPQEPDIEGDKVSWVIMDEVIYFDRDPWPREADGTGKALQRRELQRSGNEPSNWEAGFWASPGLDPSAFRISVPNHAETVLIGSSVPVAAEFDSGTITGGVSGVELFVDGASVGVDHDPPYGWVLGPLTEERTYLLTATLTSTDGTHSARPVAVCVSTVGNAEASEIGITGARLNGSLSHNGGADVSIYWGNNDGGTNASDWGHVIDLGYRRGEFSAPVMGLLANGKYYYRCRATNAYGTLWADATANFTTLPPHVSLGLQGSPFFERSGAATVRAHLNRLSAEDVTVGLAFSGVAVYGSDYAASSTSIVIAAGQDTGSITLTGLDDPEVESVESVIVSVGSLILGSPGTPAQVTATLISDDPRVVNTAPANVTDSTARVGGNLTHGYGSAVYVYWGPVDGGTSKTSWASVNTVGTTPEGPFTTTLSGMMANRTYYYRSYALNGGGDDWADSSLSFHTGPPSLAIADTDVTEGNSGTAAAVFSVSLSAKSAIDVSVAYATSDGTALAGVDYHATQGVRVVPAGHAAGQIAVPVRGDAEDEWPSENFVVTLGSPTDCTLADSQAIGTIRDDDVAVTLAPWLYKMKISFPGYKRDESLRDFPALVVFNTNLTNFAYSQLKAGGRAPSWSSLRFANSNVTALLNYDVERWNTNGRSHVWVQVPELSGSNAFIWAYWGNPSVTDPPSFSTNGAAWSAGYRGVWHMESANARDATPRGHHGTAVGSVTPVGNGVIAAANEFDADMDYIAVPDSDDFTLPGDYTISAWIYSDDIGNQEEGFVGTYNGNGFMYALQNNSDNTLRIWTGDWRPSDRLVQDGCWTHVAYTRKGIVGRHYMNGILVRDRTDARDIGNGGELQLGAGGTSWSGNRFDGKVDEVRISTEARSSNWVWACWLNQASNEVFTSFGEAEAADTNSPSIFVVYGATNVTDSSACLTARLTSTGTAETAVWVYWGAEDGGQDPDSWAHGHAFGPVTTTPHIDYTFCATGLQANTPYVYAYRAANGRGTNWASAHFNAVGGPLVDNAGGATNAGVGTATLRGRLRNASPGQVTVYWGPADGGENKLAWAVSAALGAVGGRGAFAAEADGLLYGVRYYYRCHVSNAYGEDWSDTASIFFSAAPDPNALTVLNGLVLWLDAGDVDGDGNPDNNPADGASLPEWRDRSGFVHHADNVDGGTPRYVAAGLNARPVIGFDGSSYLYTTYDFDAMAGHSILSVARYTGGDSERVVGSRTHNWFFGYWGNSDERWHAEGWIYGGGTANTDWHLHAGRITGDPDPVAGFWKDGRVLTLDSRGSSDQVYKPGRLGLGGGNGAGSEASRCEIAEVLIYDRVLGTEELDMAGSYLAKKYALATSYSGSTGVPAFGVSNGEADHVTASAARLNGTLVAAGAVFDVWLHWGDDDAGPGGAWDHSVFMGAYTNAGYADLTYAVSNLTADLSYYYTFSGHNAAGATWAEASTEFTTDMNPHDFTYKMKILFTNYAGSTPLTNFPVLVRFDTDSGVYEGLCSAMGYDLRFTSADGVRLNHELDGVWDPRGESAIWVQVPRLTCDDYIWAYWGNALMTARPAFTTNGATWSSEFSGVWHMGEPDARDSTRAGSDGTAVGGVTTTTGMIGNAQYFNNQYIDVSNESRFDHYNAVTASLWVQLSGGWNSGWQSLMGKCGDWGRGWQIRRWNGQDRFTLTARGPGWDDDPQSAPGIDGGGWHHLVAVFDYNAGGPTTKRLYLDGQETLQTVNDNVINACDDHLFIGARSPDAGERHRGNIDEVRVESAPRSSDWIRACYSNQMPGSSFVTIGSEIMLVDGIANQPASGILANEATLNALLYSRGTSYYATVYWGPSDGGADASAWAHTNALETLYADTGMTNISYRAAEGISEFGTNYYTWRVTRGPHSAWAQPSTFWSAQREWIGKVDDSWGTAGNWLGDNVPDVAAESSLFSGLGSGDVSLDGNSYAHDRLTFSSGDHRLVDTNASPGALSVVTLINSGGANTITVPVTVTGAAAVEGGTLALGGAPFSAALIELSGGTLQVQGQLSRVAGTVSYDFESGTLDGWHNVTYTGGGTQDAFINGHQPDNDQPRQGNWGINTWGQENPDGNSDGYTGIMETEPFIIAAPGTVSFMQSSSPSPFYGDPDSPENNMTCVNLEREVTPGNWEMILTSTHGANWDWQNVSWDTTPFVGATVRLRVYDTHTGGWGHTAVDNIVATGFDVIGVGPVDLTGVPIVVTGNAALCAVSDASATVGALTLSDGATLTISGSADPITIEDAAIAAGESAVGFDTSADAYLSGNGLDGAGAAATITKTGSRNLILDVPGRNLGSAAFDVRAGGLVGVHSDAFGGAALSLTGGELILSSPGGNVTYSGDLDVKADSALTAGQAGGGAAGPLTVNLDGSIAFTGSQALTVRATGGYTLRLGGQIDGGGTLNLTAGHIIVDDPDFNAVSLNGGSLTVYDNLTVNSLVQSGGSFAMAGANRDLTVSAALTLAGTLNFTGANLVLTTAVVTLNSGANITYDQALVAGRITINGGATLLVTGDALTADTLTINSGGTLNLGDNALTVGALTLNSGGTLMLGTNALSVGTFTWRNGGNLVLSGPINASTLLSIWPQRTIANALSGTGDVYIGDPSDSWGYVALTGTNAYTGKTQLRRAVLRAEDGVGMPTNSRLVFRAEGYDQHCVLETSGTFSRNIGQAAGEVYWDATGVGGGFSARGGDLTVTLEGGAGLSWSSGNVGFNDRQTLIFGSEYADGMVELTNPIDLNDAADRRIHIQDNVNVKTDKVRLSGAISGDGNWSSSQLRYGEGRDRNFRNALLELTGSNSYTHRTVIRGGALYAISGVGLPASSILLFQSADAVNDESVLLSSGTFMRDIGSDNEAPGRVSWWWGPGGFAARGGNLAVHFPNAANPLDWGSNNRGFNGQGLQLNSRYADRKVTIINNINIGGGGRGVTVFDNPDYDTDIGELSGVLSGSNADDWLYKNGPGTLWLSGLNNMQQGMMIDLGVVRANPGMGLRTNSRIRFRSNGQSYPSGVLEGKGTFSRTLGDGINQVRWEPWDKDGGFAAYGGRFTVDIGAGGEIEIGSVDYLWRPRLVLGSWTANDEVDFVTDLNLRNEWNYVKVYDNTNALTDRTVMSGNLRNGYLRVYGNGVLRMTGNNDLKQLAIQDTATVLVNGTHSSTEWVWTENSHAAGLGGSGRVTVPNLEIRTLARLMPGDGAGTLTTAVSSGNGLYMQSGSTYEWELGAAGADTVAQTGNLRLDRGWTLKVIGAGGVPRATRQYDLFTYTGTFTGTPTPASIDLSAVPADWVTSGLQVRHDAVGKRVYLSGLYSLLSVANDPPADVTSTSATLRGVVSAQSDPLHVSLYWSTTDGGTDVASWLAAGFGADKGTYSNVVGQSLNHAVTGLDTNSLWYYTFHATNADGTLDLWGRPVIAFHALGPPAVVNTGASGVDIGIATLNGAFTDHNRGAVTLCWGTVDGGTGSPLSWQHSVNIGLQAGTTFSVDIDDLLYPMGYVYRCYAVNAYGSDWSDAVSGFTQSARPGPHLPRVSGSPVAHYDAAKGITTDGSGVLNWADQSGNGHTATRSEGTLTWASDQLNGNPVVRFRNNAYANAAGTMYSKEQYVVVKLIDGDWGAVMGCTQARTGYMLNQNGNFWDGNYPAAVSKNSAVLPNPPYSLGDNGPFMIVKIVGNDWNTSLLEYALGRSEGWRSLNMDLAELIVFGAALSGDDEAKVGGYLAQKYAIDGYPPVDVPNQVVPTIVNARATDVGVGSATLNATLSCTGAIYDAWVYWGTVDGGTSRGSWDLGHAYAGTVTNAAATVSHVIAPGTGTYWYTFIASNALDQIWATPSTNVATVTEPAVDNSTGAVVSVGRAILQGELTAGNAADIYIYWGRSDGGLSTNYEYVLRLPDIQQGGFAATVDAGYGFSNYYYVCFASNDAGTAWAAASTNFTMPVPPGGYTYEDGLNGSVFQPTAGDESPVNLDGATYEVSFSRVFTGDKPGTILAMSELPAKNIILRGPANTWNEFGGSPGDNFVAALSGRFLPTVSGSHNFRWSQDDRGLMFIDMADDGVFDNSDRVGPYAWSGDGNKALTAGRGYNFLFFSQEFGGGDNLAFWYTPPGGSEMVVNPTSQSPQWRHATGSIPLASIINTPVSSATLTADSAALNGDLAGVGWSFDVYVYYGRANGAEVAADWETNQFVGTFHNHNGSIGFAVTDLVAASPYYYAFRATNSATNIWAQPSGAFETVGPLTVDNGPVSALTQTGATLGASVLGGGKGDLRIYWGLNDGGTDARAWENTNSLGEVLQGSHRVTVSVSAGAPYCYRAYAANSVDADWADATATFQTPVPAVTLSTAPMVFGATNLPGCVLWLAADDIDGDGRTDDNPGADAPVNAWHDRSGLDHDAIVEGTGAPACNRGGPNAKPVVTFDGTDYMYTPYNFDAHTAYSIMTVARYSGADYRNWVFGSRTRDWRYAFEANADERWYAGGWIRQGGGGNTGWHVHAGQITGDADPKASFWKDGILLVAGSTGSGNGNHMIGQLSLGGYRDNNSESKCEIAEVLIYERVLLPDELQQVGAYLSAKYAVGTAYGMAEDEGQVEVSAALSAPSISNVTVNFSFAGSAVKDGDYTSSADRVVIAAGTLSSSITLTATDDAEREEDETIVVGIGSLAFATNGTPANVVPRITSDDPEVTHGSGETDLGESSATLTGVLSMGDSAVVNIFWGDNDGGTTAASWDATNTLGAQLEDLSFSTAITGLLANNTYYYRGCATNASLLGEDWADGTISFDTLTPSITMDDISVQEGDSGDAIATFTVTISALSAVNVSVNFATSNGTATAGLDYAATNGTVTIQAGQPSATFAVNVTGDTVFEYPDDVFYVHLTNPVDCRIAQARGVVTIIDDDAAGHLLNWRNRMPITFDGYSGTTTLTNWPALVRLGAGIRSFDYASFASGTGGDLRFANAGATRVLNFEIERWDTNGESVVWVQIPELPPGGTTIWAYWNNPGETALPSYASDGSAWADGFASVWHMNEASAKDASRRGHDGAAQGTVACVDGIIGRANDFDPGEYIRVPSSTDWLLQSKDFTMSAWVYAHDTSGEHGIFGTWGSQFIFAVRQGNAAFHANGQVFWNSGAAVALNSWKYVTITRQGIAWRVYVDGVVRDTNPQNGGNRSIDNYRELEIGSGGHDWHGWWNGVIDEPRIERMWRSTDWVKASYDNQRQGSAFNEYGAIEGTSLNVDEDGDGLPDAWERDALGGTHVTSGMEGEDWDADGTSDRDEFIAGTLATNGESCFRIDLFFSNGEFVVGFEGLEAHGPGYDGRQRFYGIERGTNLLTGPWQPVPNRTNLLGRGARITHTNGLDTGSFYRGRARLQ